MTNNRLRSLMMVHTMMDMLSCRSNRHVSMERAESHVSREELVIVIRGLIRLFVAEWKKYLPKYSQRNKSTNKINS